MQRDPELIRALMLLLETASKRVTGHEPVPGYSADQVAYHLALLLKDGYAEGPEPRYSSTGGDPTIPRGVMVDRLTTRGHDLIDTLRQDSVWQKVKGRLASVGGGVSLEMLSQLGAAVAKQALGLPAG